MFSLVMSAKWMTYCLAEKKLCPIWPMWDYWGIIIVCTQLPPIVFGIPPPTANSILCVEFFVGLNQNKPWECHTLCKQIRCISVETPHICLNPCVLSLNPDGSSADLYWDVFASNGQVSSCPYPLLCPFCIRLHSPSINYVWFSKNKPLDVYIIDVFFNYGYLSNLRLMKL